MANSLINQSSPYLLQHAHNPVDWHPWGDDALALARRLDRPILLSIGYSACHWCHVMERESFENEKIAELMNDNFVCIKVDREERPDLDRIYQIAHQLLTQRPGGWPLTVALTPKGNAPYFAGTYFPPESRFNMPGFPELLLKLSRHYRDNHDELQDYHQSFNRAMLQLNPAPDESGLPDPTEVLDKAVSELRADFDHTFGGFGNPPKFPHPTQLGILMAHCQNNSDTDSRDMLKLTLDRMALGGLFDHLGGGFFRYSTDREWKIPHFEKMLYDNAQLLAVYAVGAAEFGDARYLKVVEMIGKWVIHEMQLDNGGYAATLDADSQEEEGKFYVWDETDLRAVLTETEFEVIENYFGMAGEPNFEGHWHLNVNTETDFELLDNSPDIVRELNSGKDKLLGLRRQRERPALDDKIIASWNGLMVMAMARGARFCELDEFRESAARALTCVRNNHWQGSRLLSICSRGNSAHNAYLDDYAFLLLGLLEMLQAKWHTPYLDWAVDLADAMLQLFEDRDIGGFFFTSHDHEDLLYRIKSGSDDAIPSGNGAAVLGLIKLANLIAEPRYLEAAERTLKLFARDLNSRPSVSGLLALALQEIEEGHGTAIIRGNPGELADWRSGLTDLHSGNTSVYLIPENERNLPPGLAVRRYPGSACAYLCRGTTCTPPIAQLDLFKQQVNSGKWSFP